MQTLYLSPRRPNSHSTACCARSYRDLEEMMAERGLSVDHTTIYRSAQHYAPELDRRVQWCRNRNSGSWYVDETYVKVRGE